MPPGGKVWCVGHTQHERATRTAGRCAVISLIVLPR
jgi:hypothetical protein